MKEEQDEFGGDTAIDTSAGKFAVKSENGCKVKDLIFTLLKWTLCRNVVFAYYCGEVSLRLCTRDKNMWFKKSKSKKIYINFIW